MRAVVLVGGFGTRLRPLTNSVPKPMLPVVHVPIIERLVANLARGGVTDVTLGLGFRPEPFVEAFPDSTCAGVALRYAVEPEPLDTAGAIRFAADAAGIDDTFVVANGDILTDLDVGALVEFHRARRAEATIHLIPVDDPSSFGVVALDDDGRVERFVEKPAPGTAPSNLINAGTYVLEASVLARIPVGAEDRRSSGSRSRRSPPTAACSPWRPTTPGSTPAAPSCTSRPTSTSSTVTRPPACTPIADVSAGRDDRALRDRCRRAVVARGAMVERSVVLPGAVIGANAVVRDSVVMGTVGPGAWVERCVLGADGVVAADERVADERRPAPEG